MVVPHAAKRPLGYIERVAANFFAMTPVNANVVNALDAVQGNDVRPALQDLSDATPDSARETAIVSPEIKLGTLFLDTYALTPSAPTSAAQGNVRQKSCLGTHSDADNADNEDEQDENDGGFILWLIRVRACVRVESSRFESIRVDALRRRPTVWCR